MKQGGFSRIRFDERIVAHGYEEEVGEVGEGRGLRGFALLTVKCLERLKDEVKII